MASIRSKTSVQLTALSLLFCSGAVLLWACWATVSVPIPTATSGKPPMQPPREEGQQDERDVTSRWSRLFECRFQRPLYDPPVEPPAPVVKKVVPPPPIEVIATMPEPGGGHAMIKDDRGSVSVVPVGATVSAGGARATLLKVFDDRIELQHEGRVVTVKLKID